MLRRTSCCVNKWRLQRAGKSTAPLRQTFRTLSDLNTRVEEEFQRDYGATAGRSPQPITSHMRANREMVRGEGSKQFVRADAHTFVKSGLDNPECYERTYAQDKGHANTNLLTRRDPKGTGWFSSGRNFDEQQVAKDNRQIEQQQKQEPRKLK